jgi:hypothetical protein
MTCTCATRNAPGHAGATAYVAEGVENQPNLQEGTDLNVSVSPDQTLITAPAVDPTRVFTPSARWRARTVAGSEHAVALTEAELMPTSEAPPWADPESTAYGTVPNSCMWRSRTYSVVLDSGVGHWNDYDKLIPARVEMYLYQNRRSSEPRIRIVRKEQNVDAGVATVRLSLDEAAELAHGILLAIDVARGTADEVA